MSKYLRALAYGLSTVAIYLLLSLVGWGLDDLGGFFALYPRAGYAVAAAAFALAVAWQGIDAPEGVSGGPGDPAKLVKRQTAVGYTMSLLLFAALIALPWADRRGLATWPQGDLTRWLGLALVAAAYTLIFWSGLALGRMYSSDVTIQPDHRLITTGLYRTIRHPRYLGLILAAVGMAALYRSWLGLALLPLLAAILYLRIRDEEALMRREFGAAWQDYCRRSWRLVPFLY